MNYVISRLREKSTWTGLATIVAGLTFLPHAAEISAVIPEVGAAVISLVSLYNVFRVG